MGYADYTPNGRYSTDYNGSRDEWIARAARDLALRYSRGEWPLGIDGANTAVAAMGFGMPNLGDYGNGTWTEQTVDFFARYLERNSATDPNVTNAYGSMPTRTATWGTDPNSPAALNLNRTDLLAEAERNRQLQREDIAAANARNAADNASRIQAAQISAAASLEAARIDAGARIEATRMQVESDWKIAVLRDATDRYIAEGNWGVQKYIAELQENGAMERLKLELGMREQELAQRALEAKQQHHANMVSLALEVAKYDAQLASQPRNWLAYASWLKQRDIIVNGLNLAAAADMVDPQVAVQAAAEDPAAQADGTAGVTAQTQITEDQKALTSGASGGAATPGGAPGGVQEAALPAALQQEQAAGTGEYDPNKPFPVGGVDLNSTDYAAIARALMGIGAEGTQQPTVEDLQKAYDLTSTTGGRVAGFNAWGGPTKNAQGIEVNPMGHKENYANFTDLLPTLQEMRVGAVESVRGTGGIADWAKEMERSRPKGYTATGTAGLG